MALLQHQDPFIGWPAVQQLVGISRTTAWRMGSAFPAAHRISANRVAWRLSEIVAWLSTRPTASAS